MLLNWTIDAKWNKPKAKCPTPTLKRWMEHTVMYQSKQHPNNPLLSADQSDILHSIERPYKLHRQTHFSDPMQPCNIQRPSYANSRPTVSSSAAEVRCYCWEKNPRGPWFVWIRWPHPNVWPAHLGNMMNSIHAVDRNIQSNIRCQLDPDL